MCTWQFPCAVGDAADEDRVVEVARGLAVDGDNGEFAKIATASGDGGIEAGDFTRLCEDGVGRSAGDGACG